MRTLVIHAPDRAVIGRGAQSFEHIMSTGVGRGYAIYGGDIAKLEIPGSTVVLLRKDGRRERRRRAEGVLVSIAPTANYARKGRQRQRHDVHVSGFRPVGYKPEKLNRCGYAIIQPGRIKARP